MYLFSNTHAILTNTIVASNTPSNAATGYAGGIYPAGQSADSDQQPHRVPPPAIAD
jgi:hypothetical protein